jgi:hypothetical protein
LSFIFRQKKCVTRAFKHQSFVVSAKALGSIDINPVTNPKILKSFESRSFYDLTFNLFSWTFSCVQLLYFQPLPSACINHFLPSSALNKPRQKSNLLIHANFIINYPITLKSTKKFPHRASISISTNSLPSPTFIIIADRHDGQNKILQHYPKSPEEKFFLGNFINLRFE